MSNCYLMQMKPFDEVERQDEKRMKEFQINSINNRVCGMGWDLENTYAGHKLEDSIIEYKKEYEKKWSSSNAFSASLNIYNEIEVGDYILTRLITSDCYIGKVTSKAYYRNPDLFKDCKKYSWIVDVEWQTKPTSFLNMPNALRGIMNGRWNTAKRVPKGSVHESLIQGIYDGNINKVWLNKDNFHTSLDADDLEDLVALYISKENPDYLLLPSSCKISEPLYEFKFVNKTGDIITCQVKNNKEINVSEYNNKKFKKIYLFSGSGYINAENHSKNIRFISKESLFELLATDFSNKGIFYNLLQEYYCF